MSQELIERIYEAAFSADLWPGVLKRLGALSGADSGTLLIFSERHPPLFTATPIAAAELSVIVPSVDWRSNARALTRAAANHSGFLRDLDHMSVEQREADPLQASMRSVGVEFQATASFIMPSGEVVLFTVERSLAQGQFTSAMLADLDTTAPHLARAGLLAARLGLERARTMVATLDAIGLPAAVLSPTGRALAVNSLLETLSAVQPAAFGGLFIVDRIAQDLFQQALQAQSTAMAPLVSSIAIRPQSEAENPSVLHLLPLRRSAYDVFSGAATLVIVTPIATQGAVPGAALLNALFDLTPAESHLAAAIAGGTTLKAAALQRGVALATARSQLAQIFRKTGTAQQSQLVALLKSAQPIAPRGADPST